MHEHVTAVFQIQTVAEGRKSSHYYHVWICLRPNSDDGATNFHCQCASHPERVPFKASAFCNHRVNSRCRGTTSFCCGGNKTVSTINNRKYCCKINAVAHAHLSQCRCSLRLGVISHLSCKSQHTHWRTHTQTPPSSCIRRSHCWTSLLRPRRGQTADRSRRGGQGWIHQSDFNKDGLICPAGSTDEVRRVQVQWSGPE